jgi:hypothetical protein
MRPRWLVLAVLSFCLLSLAPPATTSETAGTEPDVAIWKNGDLMPPLPKDESLRAQALARAEAGALARLAALQRVEYLGGATAGAHVMPVHAVPRTPSSARSAVASDMSAVRERIDAAMRAASPPSIVPPGNGTTTAPSIDVPQSPAVGIGAQPGIDDTGLFPASPDICIGTDKVIIATTDRFQVRNRCGTAEIDQTFRDYWGFDPSIALYDPVTIYDEWSNRYILAYIAYRNVPQLSMVYMAVSTDGTATNWYYYPIPLAAAGNFADDVSIAVSPFGIYLTGNEFDHITYAFEGTTIVELIKSDIYNQLGTSVYTRRNLTHPVDASAALSVRPAQMHSYPGAVYFVASKHVGSNQYTLYTLTGVPGSSSLASVNVPGFAYSPAPNPQQPNLTFVKAPDCRVLDAAYDAGTVYMSQNVAAFGTACTYIAFMSVASATSSATVFGSPPASIYPAIDVDDYGRVGVVFCGVSTTEFISMRYAIITPQTATVHDAGLIQGGLANYTAGGTPYRWGNHNGIARDPVDDHSFWMHAGFASNSPTPSWTTLVYRAGTPGGGNLVVTPPLSLITSGFEGGPFNPPSMNFQLQNTGGGTVSWRVSTWPSWAEMSATFGTIAPYSSQTIQVNVGSWASSYTQAYYLEALAIENCSGTGSWNGAVGLSVGYDYNCPGASAYLFPLDQLPTLTSTHDQPGTYITAIEDAELCAVGIYADIDVPQLVTLSIYEAIGTTTGGFLYGTAVNLFNPEPGFHYIPVEFELQECREYLITLDLSGSWSYPAFDENLFERPFDAGGLVRVRDGAIAGNAGGTELPPMFVIASSSSCSQSASLGDYNGSDPTPNTLRGNMITAKETHRLCSVGINVSAAPGTRLTANVNDIATGVLATGSAFVTLAGMNEVHIPVSAVLIAGHDYNIDVSVPGSATVATDPTQTTPYTVQWFEVTNGSRFSGPHPIVTDMTLGWSDDEPGYPFYLIKPGPTSFNLSGPVTRGMYVTAQQEQDVYTLGILGDIAAGETVTARVYRAVGNVRGPLLSEGSMTSSGSGQRWHDVPVAASLQPGADFDFEVEVSDATSLLMHDDTTGLPVTISSFELRDGETNGNAAEVVMPRLRVYACNRTLTPVTGGPARTPMFLANPVPNPASRDVRFGYAIEEAGPAELAIYDVAGRLVDRVFQNSIAKAGNAEARYDASRLASGVYFAKLTTQTKSLTRKFVVTH